MKIEDYKDFLTSETTLRIAYISSQNRVKWKKLYDLDIRIKSMGTALLSVLSIIIVLYGIDATKNFYLFFVILPSCLQIFNELISWYEIDNPMFDNPLLPSRILAKKEIKRLMNTADE